MGVSSEVEIISAEPRERNHEEEFDSDALIRGLKAGNAEAFTLIYRAYWYPMYTLALRKLNHREIAEEMVQDIFTRLWKDRETLQVTRLDAYLFSATRYEIIDHIRAHAREEGYRNYCQAFSKFESIDTEETVLFNDLMSSFGGSLDLLPERTRRIFYLSRIDQWPVAQIARHFGVSEKAVEYHLSKALKFMKGALKEHLVPIVLLGYMIVVS